MRILHVAPSIARSYGGPTQSLYGYVTASRLTGAEVTVAAPSASRIEVDDIETAAGAGRVHTFASAGRGAFVVSPAMVRWVRIQAENNDVVHVHGLFNPISSLCCRVALDSRAAVVLRPFGTLSRYTMEHRRSGLKKAYFAALDRNNVRQASAIHFTTGAELDEAKWHGVDFTNRAHVVPPPWTRLPNTNSERDLIRGRPRVVFIGRINPIKNVEALLAAWPGVLRVHPTALLTIAGSGGERYLESLVRVAAQLRISHTVAFPGFLSGSAKSELLAEASVLALPSHHENFGVVILEALAAGVPVVISPQVQIREFVELYKFGAVADPATPLFGDAISSLIGDTEMKARVTRDAPAALENSYGSGVIGKKLESMYLDALATRQHPR